jgi:signal transduction histidine kinase
MSNYLTLAREDLARGDAASASRRLDGVREGMNRVAGTVRQVLAQAEPGAAPRVSMDLDPLLAQTLEFVRTRPEFRGVVLSQERTDEPLRVKANAVMLGQVLLNLVLNACEAQPEGGEVVLGAHREKDEISIEVKDRGPGIPANDLARVFEPFYTTKQSTGLGLAICRSIVREHQGDLSASNRAGGGAVFRLSLPAA